MSESPETLDRSGPPMVLASLWHWWADEAAALDAPLLAAPTRCGEWTVHELLAHVAPDPDRLAAVLASPVDAEDRLLLDAVVDDAAAVLRAFNAPGGLAHVMAEQIASAAAAAVAQLSPTDAARRFREAAAVIDQTSFQPTLALTYPGVGAITTLALTHLAIVEATVHGLDLAAAIDGDLPPVAARACTLDVLSRIPPDDLLIDALTGRREAATVLPVMR